MPESPGSHSRMSLGSTEMLCSPLESNGRGVSREAHPSEAQALHRSDCSDAQDGVDADISGEWEVVDDDGFIYKRRKMTATSPISATVVKCQTPLPAEQADPTRRKKMAMLLAQKEMFAAEIRDWEILLRDKEKDLECDTVKSPTEFEESSFLTMTDPASKDDVQTLQLVVEAYEQFIMHLQNLQEQGERICKQLENTEGKDRMCLDQDLVKEVMKLTPRNIIHSLTSQPAAKWAAAELPVNSLLGRLMADGR